jgi:hypothetical protein
MPPVLTELQHPEPSELGNVGGEVGARDAEPA